MSEQGDTRSNIVNARESSAVSVSVVLDRITHYFGSRCVFRAVSGSVHAGEVLIVSGANGSGKSTLLRIIAGLLRPSSGSVGIDVGGARLSADDRRRHIGYVAPDLV